MATTRCLALRAEKMSPGAQRHPPIETQLTSKATL